MSKFYTEPEQNIIHDLFRGGVFTDIIQAKAVMLDETQGEEDFVLINYIDLFKNNFKAPDSLPTCLYDEYSKLNDHRRSWTEPESIDSTPVSKAEIIAGFQEIVKEVKHAKDNGIPELEKIRAIQFAFTINKDPLRSEVIMTQWNDLSDELVQICMKELNISPENVKFLITTMGDGLYVRDENETITAGFSELPFTRNLPEIRFSLYTVDRDLREKWFGKTEPYNEVLRTLARYKRAGGKVSIHTELFWGMNDEIESLQQVFQSAKFFNLHQNFTITRRDGTGELSPQKLTESPEQHYIDAAEFLTSKGFKVQMSNPSEDGFPSQFAFYAFPLQKENPDDGLVDIPATTDHQLGAS